jgi:hypothetical protein
VHLPFQGTVLRDGPMSLGVVMTEHCRGDVQDDVCMPVAHVNTSIVTGPVLWL